MIPRFIRDLVLNGVPSARASAEYRAAFEAYSHDVRSRLRCYAETLPASARETMTRVTPRWFLEVPDRELIKPYPVFAAEFFGIVDTEVIGRAALASNLMQLHCWLQDSRIDGDWPATECAAATDALSNILMTDSLSMFAGIAGDAQFWTLTREAFCTLADAYAAEEGGGAAGNVEAVLGRCAPFHILVAALGLHAHRPYLISPCADMSDRLLLWFQILDDLTDWRKDREQGRQAYALTLLDRQLGSRPFADWSEEEITDALYLYGGIETLLGECTCLLTQALDLWDRHAETPNDANSPASFRRWLPAMIDVHEQLRRWSVEQKREFLATH